VTTNQVLIGIGLILVLAVGSQVLASRLKIPAIIVLLPAGFTAGAITTDVNPQLLLGAAFQPLVSLAVAVILYDAGLSLDLRKLRGQTRRVVDRLIVLGVPVTFAFGAVFAGLLLGLSRQAALMTGAILVVSGPTVVGPLLTFVRPTERLQRVLSWEGSLIDPVGGILGAVVFHAVVASTRRGLGYQLGQFLLGIGAGLAGGLAGVARINEAGLELAPGELREGITAVLLLTAEDDFNALGSTVLAGGVDGPVYRLAARLPGHGVVAPYTGGEVLFDPRLTRYEVGRRYAAGTRIRTRPANGTAPADDSLLFLVRADGRLAPVTANGPPRSEPGDTMVLFCPAAEGP